MVLRKIKQLGISSNGTLDILLIFKTSWIFDQKESQRSLLSPLKGAKAPWKELGSIAPTHFFSESVIYYPLYLPLWLGKGEKFSLLLEKNEAVSNSKFRELIKKGGHIVQYEMCCSLFYVYVLIYWRKRHQNIIGKIYVRSATTYMNTKFTTGSSLHHAR